MIHRKMEVTMKSDIPKRPGQRAKAARTTAELLCLLATYEAYGKGLACSGCLRVLARKDGKG